MAKYHNFKEIHININKKFKVTNSILDPKDLCIGMRFLHVYNDILEVLEISGYFIDENNAIQKILFHSVKECFAYYHVRSFNKLEKIEKKINKKSPKGNFYEFILRCRDLKQFGGDSEDLLLCQISKNSKICKVQEVK